MREPDRHPGPRGGVAADAPSRRLAALLAPVLAPLLASPALARRVLPAEAGDGAEVLAGLRRAGWLGPGDGEAPAQGPGAATGVAAAAGAWEATEPAPVWVLASGWGSGSTLVQRLLMSSGELLLWGEPMDRAAPLQHLAAPLRALQADWPPPGHYRESLVPAALAREWVANLVPAPAALRDAQRAFLTRWLAPPDPAGGPPLRFGLKEVRLSAEYACYLKWLFPRSRFVFVHRHPADCWLSCKGVDWYSIWPRHRVAARLAFAHHWALVSASFLRLADELDALMVPYAGLVDGSFDLQRLAAHAGVAPLDATLLQAPIGSRRSPRRRLTTLDRTVIASVCGPTMHRLGYTP